MIVLLPFIYTIIKVVPAWILWKSWTLNSSCLNRWQKRYSRTAISADNDFVLLTLRNGHLRKHLQNWLCSFLSDCKARPQKLMELFKKFIVRLDWINGQWIIFVKLVFKLSHLLSYLSLSFLSSALLFPAGIYPLKILSAFTAIFQHCISFPLLFFLSFLPLSPLLLKNQFTVWADNIRIRVRCLGIESWQLDSFFFSSKPFTMST